MNSVLGHRPLNDRMNRIDGIEPRLFIPFILSDDRRQPTAERRCNMILSGDPK